VTLDFLFLAVLNKYPLLPKACCDSLHPTPLTLLWAGGVAQVAAHLLRKRTRS
jgi:hypothetical protein